MTRPAIGVDYSMSSPAMCLEKDDKFYIWYIHSKKDLCTRFEIGNVIVEGIWYDHNNINDQKKKKDRLVHSDIERFVTLSMMFDEKLPFGWEGDEAIFEAYAFGAKGRLAQIGENTGMMKAVLRCKNYNIRTVTPNQVKLHAFGHGGADKIQMAEAWFNRFGFHVHDQIGCEIGKSPASDVIDAFFVLDTWKALQSQEAEK
ncbi:RuvC-like Holliday junction resolvase [Sinorhizobium phage phiM9]|uniref:Uncharacterized protein n=1 Tax=Sinorhizobium phage phiM9 TaxID=1636182 RepID=A0A0F6R4U2_9CAUD|nr:RuvC-like Holliday junction resolvase [Sinorhizobium phage phiM9]AKE44637.1 hypothetical protein Sm_phiM9_007 [Sinorhizobium phage phiM9]